MRSHAKASTAGSTQRQAKGLGRFVRGAIAIRDASLISKGSSAPKARRLAIAASLALLASLALSASPVAASQGHYLKEVFGSAAQPSLISARDVAIDQSSGDLLVMEAGEPTLGVVPRISRFKPDGTPDNFSALGSNVIDGKEGPDATPQAELSIASQSESQIAVDNSGTATDGNIYVTHGSPNAIDIFAKTGAYLGQLTKAGATNLSEACGVAVDSSGAVYVGDYTGGIRKYVPSGAFPVNTDNTATFTTTTQPCTLAAGAGPTAGYLFPARFSGEVSKIDATTGELKYSVAAGSHVTVAVDPGTGHVYAAASKAIEEFDASGAAPTQLSNTKVFESIHGLDVRGSSGEIYLVGEQTSFANFRAEIYDDPIATIPDLTTTAATANTGTHATLNGTVNPDGVELSECRFEWTQSNKSESSFIAYDHTVPCAETPAAIGSGTSPVAVHADISNLTPQGVPYAFRLAAKNPTTTLVKATTQLGFNTPNTVITTAASGITSTTATLNGTVNPDGVAITACEFEWGLTSAYGNTAPCVPNPAGIGSGTSAVPVSAAISGLHPGTTYHYRLKAANANGPIAPAADLTVQSAGPRIPGSWAENVLLSEATFKAEIDPEGAATTFRVEYGPTEAYGSESAELNVASDSSVHTVSFTPEDLQPGTEYHYRAIATSAAGTNVGPDRTIRTFVPFSAETDCPNQANRYAVGATLPDCRAYEMVSPLEKADGDIQVGGDFLALGGALEASLTQSTPSGDKLTYSSSTAFGDAQSAPWSSQYIAQRTAEGWQTHSINLPAGAAIVNGFSAFTAQYQAFSEDLCQGWVNNFFEPPLAPGALARVSNIYRRSDRLCGPERFEAVGPIVAPSGATFQGASADGSHAVFLSGKKLTPEGTEGLFQTYESVEPEAAPRFVCILPNGEPWTGSCVAGSGGALGIRQSVLAGAISEDGERIFWSDHTGRNEAKIYVRIGGAETLAVSAPGEAIAGTTKSWFWGAAADGSRAVYTTGDFGSSHLFAFDVDSEATEPIAEGVYGVIGMSKDARRIYFVSSKAIPGSGQNSEGAEAIAGQRNAYFYDADKAGGTSTFIGTLASEDAREPYESGPVAREPDVHNARVTPDGLHAVFSSLTPLTGYDNRNLTTGFGEFYAEAFVYDAESGELHCASCDPSGARDHQTIPGGKPSRDNASVLGFETALHGARVLSDDGSRFFFQNAAALTPRDSNGRLDTYEWEELGAGSCDANDSTYAPSNGGCVSLISSGASSFDSRFAEATPDGRDAFFYTTSSLVPQDYGLRDIYDARVGGGNPLPPEAPECVGDACQSIPAAPSDPTPASAGFRGAGNPTPRKARKRRCRARASHAGKRANHKKAAKKSCKRAKRRAGR